MAETTGKCSNFASCTLAYRNEPIPFTGNPVCPECGQPLTTKTASKGLSPLVLIGGIAVVLAIAGGGAYFAFARPKPAPPQPPVPPHTEDTAASPSTPAPTAPEPEPSNPTPSIAANTPAATVPDSSTPPTPAPAAPDQPANPVAPVPETPSTTPPPTIASLMPAAQTPERETSEPVSVEKTIDTNIKGDENQKVRAEVLKRIDLMPNISAGDRSKLYTRVDHAHGMGKVITIPFAMGSRAVGAKETEQLKSALQSPQVANLIKDPTVVFVLLGFADKRGDEKANQKISIDRAENISQTLKEKCGMQNVTQAVGMGGSALFDTGNLAKNRVVEVWAVVP